MRPWQRKPRGVVPESSDPSRTEWVDLAGRFVEEQTIFRLELRRLGHTILWTEGGARAVVEEALRQMLDQSSSWHDFPQTFEIELRRLRGTTPRYPIPPVEVERPE